MNFLHVMKPIVIHYTTKHLFHNLLQTVEKFGGIDILVSNAAVNPVMGGVLDVSMII